MTAQSVTPQSSPSQLRAMLALHERAAQAFRSYGVADKAAQAEALAVKVRAALAVQS